MIERMRRSMRHVFWLFVVLFALTAGYLLKIAVLDAREIAQNPYNRRLNAENKDRMPGKILDSAGVILAESVPTDSGYIREYAFGRAFSHVLGTRLSKTGLETRYNFDMQSLDFEIWQRIDHLVTGRPIEGDTIVTTLNAALQSAAYEKLNGRAGAVVALEPSTGRVLAMVSAPDFPPVAATAEWEALLADAVNSPLLNRATQGLYAPGSTFKLLVATALLESDMAGVTVVCGGQAAFGTANMRCFDGKAHGEVKLAAAMAHSCNVYFATMGEALGAEALRAVAERYGFNNFMDYPLEYSMSTFPLAADAARDELIETAIGQGRTLATPMQMCLAAAMVANGGVSMRPYLLDSIQTRDLRVLEKCMPVSNGTVLAPNVAAALNEMLVGVVAEGTGTPAQVPSVTTAGKTGTAENATGNDHSWFVGYAPAERPEIAIAVLLEETGGGTAASALAGALMEMYLTR